jgi:hypothetical protein
MVDVDLVLSMRIALEFYANPDNWDRTGYPDEGPVSVAEGDGGQRARNVLGVDE